MWRCVHPEEARLVDDASARLADVRRRRGRNRGELRRTMDAWARSLLRTGASERAQARARRLLFAGLQSALKASETPHEMGVMRMS